MPRKFIYGPGLPGYGTAGTDGSTGLTGLGVFFSAYDGNSDTVTIKGKILANKELFSNDVLVPGYPSRVYQTGDIFIDKNARIFQIDLAESNLYKDTGIFLNTSGFFSEGPSQVLSPGFQRYSNAFETEKFLIDVVYTNSVGDYTQYPYSIYDNAATYFGKVSYIGDDVVADLNGWYPFEIWTIGNNVTGNDSVALARKSDTNEWHFGNADGGVIRDISIYFDFNDFYCPSIVSYSSETDILYWDRTTGRIAQGPAPSGMIMSNYAANRVITAGNSATNIYANSNFTYDGTLLSLEYDMSIGRDILFSPSDDHEIVVKMNPAGHGNDLIIYTEDATPISSYNCGDIRISAGDGGGSVFSAGDGGNIIISSGKGGTSTVPDPGIAGTGGDIDISAGRGGTLGQGSQGGDIRIYAGGSENTDIGSVPGDIFLIPGDRAGSWTNAGSVYIASNESGASRGTALFAKGTSGSPGIAFASSFHSGFFYSNTPNPGIGVSVASIGEQFRFDSSSFHAKGNIIAYSSSISDIRLKKNISPLINSLDKILLLNGITYERKINDEKHTGYVAQEFEKILPDLILESPILGEDENISYKTIKYTELIPYLSEAIKEQQDHISNLEKKIEDLNSKIEFLINDKNNQ